MRLCKRETRRVDLTREVGRRSWQAVRIVVSRDREDMNCSTYLCPLCLDFSLRSSSAQHLRNRAGGSGRLWRGAAAAYGSVGCLLSRV